MTESDLNKMTRNLAKAIAVVAQRIELLITVEIDDPASRERALETGRQLFGQLSDYVRPLLNLKLYENHESVSPSVQSNDR